MQVLVLDTDEYQPTSGREHEAEIALYCGANSVTRGLGSFTTQTGHAALISFSGRGMLN